MLSCPRDGVNSEVRRSFFTRVGEHEFPACPDDASRSGDGFRPDEASKAETGFVAWVQGRLLTTWKVVLRSQLWKGVFHSRIRLGKNVSLLLSFLEVSRIL